MQSRGVTVLFILICFQACSLIAPTYAVANPITITLDRVNTGTTVSLTENVSMPKAEVDITISSEESYTEDTTTRAFNHSIEMESSFQISSDCDQNVSIAFAYPSDWSSRPRNVTTFEMHIYLNGTPVDFTVMSASDLNPDSEYELDVADTLSEAQLAVINASLSLGYTYVLEVYALIELTSSANVFVFRYFVATARFWDGFPQEMIQISVENPDIFRSVTFYPEESLTAAEYENSKAGIWSLEFPDFGYDVVEVNIDQYYYEEPTPVVDLYALGQIGVLAVIVIMALFLGRRYEMRGGRPTRI